MRPDVIVMFDTDHLNTFFLDNLPIFAVGVDKTFKAPNDEPREVPDLRGAVAAGSSPRISARPASTAGFDVGMTQEFSVDHSVTVPLHFLTPQMQIPVVPFFVSGHVPPLPRRSAASTLGRAVKPRHRDLAADRKRVVIMGSGSFSLDVSAARAWRPGRTDGVPDPDWCTRVCKLLEEQQIDTLIRRPPSTRCSRPAMSAANC